MSISDIATLVGLVALFSASIGFLAGRILLRSDRDLDAQHGWTRIGGKPYILYPYNADLAFDIRRLVEERRPSV